MGVRQTVMAVTVTALAALGKVPGTAGAQFVPGRRGDAGGGRLRAQRGRAPRTAAAPLDGEAVARHGRAAARGGHGRGAAAWPRESPEGEGPGERARRAGYMDHAERWRIGEVLIWTRGAKLTAAAAVQAWLGSPGHRAVILRAGYRDAGVGIAGGAPQGSPDARPATTIAVVTGRRS